MVHLFNKNKINGHLIDDAKTKLAQLNVKNFNFSVINMLTEFMNLVDEISNLGGTISTEDQAFHFWQAVKTMKEQRFSYFCDAEHDWYCAAIGTAKPSIFDLIEQFNSIVPTRRNKCRFGTCYKRGS